MHPQALSRTRRSATLAGVALTAALTALNLTAAPATARPPAGPSAGATRPTC